MKEIQVRVHPELFELIAAQADRDQISMGKFFVRLAARFFKRPDLTKSVRRPGRPRKQVVAS